MWTAIWYVIYLPKRLWQAFRFCYLKAQTIRLRARFERYLATLPEDEARRIRAEHEADMAQARREILGDDPLAHKLVE